MITSKYTLVFYKFEIHKSNKMEELPIEILGEITAAIKGDFIAWTSVCKLLHSFNTIAERAKRSNHLLTLLKLFPNAIWHYPSVAKNPNLTWEFVEANPQINWYNWLSENPSISSDIVSTNLNKLWYYEFLSRNPSITWELVKANPNKHWDYVRLSKNPIITWEIVEANPHISWADNSCLKT